MLQRLQQPCPKPLMLHKTALSKATVIRKPHHGWLADLMSTVRATVQLQREGAGRMSCVVNVHMLQGLLHAA